MIEEARNKGRKVHFASLMDLCHLKNSELEPQCQKYKGRVVLRGDIVKDDSGSYAVFTRMSRYLDTSTEAQMAQIMVQYGRPSRSSRKESVRSFSGRTIMGKAT